MDFYSEKEWQLLKELSKMDSRSALEWLKAHDVDLDHDDLCGDGASLKDVNLNGDFTLFIGGFWSDGAPTIEFEDGHVARWYRGIYWD